MVLAALMDLLVNVSRTENVSRVSPSATAAAAATAATAATEQGGWLAALPFVEVAVMGLIFLVSTVGNSVVVLIVFRKRRMQTVTNWLILNLAVADLGVSILCIPLEIPLVLNRYEWLYGPALCPVIYPLQTISIYGSVLTLVALCVTRYWAVLKPMRPQPTPKHAKFCIAAIWVVSVAVVIPYIVNLKYVSDPPQCSEKMSKVESTVYTVVILISQYLLPLTVMSIAYALIALDLKRGLGIAVAIIDRHRRRETTKVVKMLFVVTLTFSICVLPSHVVTLLDQMNVSSRYLPIGITISYLMLYANSAINPLIYNACNESFRQGFREYLNLSDHCHSRGEKSPLSQKHSLIALKTCRSSPLLCVNAQADGESV